MIPPKGCAPVKRKRMITNDLNLPELISPAFNAPLDEELHRKILALRAEMIELEKTKSDTNPIPEGSHDLLVKMQALEADLCSLAAFLFYCEEMAHAYMLNDKPDEALEYAASALTCAQIMEREAAQAELFGLLFKVAITASDFKMAMDFLEQKKAIRPLDEDMNEAYESMEALVENDMAPKSRFRLKGEELPIAPALLALLEGGPAEMAARFICRGAAISLEEARKEAVKLTPKQLNVMFAR